MIIRRQTGLFQLSGLLFRQHTKSAAHFHAQAGKLKEAGLTAYNHNLDTSPEFYGSIITTRVYEDRLKTLAAVRKAGITVCCGGSLGVGGGGAGHIRPVDHIATLAPPPDHLPSHT